MVGVAVNVTEPPVQIEVVLEAIDTEGTTAVVVIVIALLVAVTGFAQGSLLLIVTVTISPLFKVVVVKVEDVCPATFTPLIFHWYVGVVPPLVGVAVKVTEPPVHIEVVLEAIETEGTTAVVVTVIALLAAVTGLAQGSLLLIVTVTTSPLFKVVVVKVDAV